MNCSDGCQENQAAVSPENCRAQPMGSAERRSCRWGARQKGRVRPTSLSLPTLRWGRGVVNKSTVGPLRSTSVRRSARSTGWNASSTRVCGCRFRAVGREDGSGDPFPSERGFSLDTTKAVRCVTFAALPSGSRGRRGARAGLRRECPRRQQTACRP